LIRVVYRDPESQREVTADFDAEHIRVGREGGNELVLPYMEVSRYHAELTVGDRAITITDRSTNGTFVNGERVFGKQVIQPGDRLGVGNCVLSIYTEEQLRQAEANQAYYAQQQAAQPQEQYPADYYDQQAYQPEGQAQDPNAGTALVPAGEAQQQYYDQAAQLAAYEQAYGSQDQLQVVAGGPMSAAPVDLKRRIHRRLLQYMDLKTLDMGSVQEEELRARARNLLIDIIGELEADIDPAVDREMLIKEVLDEALGLGPLEDLLEDDAVTEVMVVNKDKIYIEKSGKLTYTGKTFTTHEAVLAVIERIITPLGRRIDESSPLVDARLKDGSRVNAIIPPLAIKGPCITIRKFAKKSFTVQDLINFGSMTPQIANFLQKCVLGRRNIVISGGTGSGKTTLLNVLSGFIPAEERIVTIEDAAELRLPQEHVVSLETKPANLEGKGEYTIRDLVKNSLRMRPDRIVVGECRGGESLDMLQAMNTGHDGSLTTGHANSPSDMMNRLETMVLMAGMDLPIRAIRDQISSAIDIVVQQDRFSDGTRRITAVTEVVGLDEDGRLILEHIFEHHQRGIAEDGTVLGEIILTGYIPSFIPDLVNRGIIETGGTFL
jgi:pilus assembly protein CpaF